MDWSLVPEGCRAVKRLAAARALECSRLGPGGDFELFNPRTGEFLSLTEWPAAVRSEFPPMSENFPAGELWLTLFAEDGFVARGFSSKWVLDKALSTWDIVPSPTMQAGAQSLPRLVSYSGARGVCATGVPSTGLARPAASVMDNVGEASHVTPVLAAARGCGGLSPSVMVAVGTCAEE